MKSLQLHNQLVLETKHIAHGTQKSKQYAIPSISSTYLQESPNLMKQIVPEDHVDAIIELAPLFSVSFGNYQRIDYGTGHEAAFITWLLALRVLGLIPTSDNQALVSRVFSRYMPVITM